MINRFETRLLVMTLTLLFGGTKWISAKEVLTVVGDPWCPFTCKADSAQEGVVVEIARAVFEPEFEVKYSELPWARAIEDTRKGNYTALVGALKSDAPDFVFPDASPVFQRSCYYVVKGKSWKYKSIADVKRIVLGITKDYSYGEPLDEYLKSHLENNPKLEAISGVDTTLRLLKKLAAGRLDAIVDDESVVNYLLANNEELKKANIVPVGCQKKVPLYIAFSPKDKAKSKHLAEIASKRIKDMQKDGRMQKLLRKYGI